MMIAGLHHGSRSKCGKFGLALRKKSDFNAKLLKRPDGGVVTQRTANPYTPVRFRLGPPSLSFFFLI